MKPLTPFAKIQKLEEHIAVTDALVADAFRDRSMYRNIIVYADDLADMLTRSVEKMKDDSAVGSG